MTDKFYVGQRVKYVKSINVDLPTGITLPLNTCGTITRHRLLCRPINQLTPSLNYYVKLDGYHSGVGDGSFSALEEQLAQIYDGDTLVAWSDCAWRPKELVKA